MKVTTFHNLDSRFMPYEAGQRLVRVFETEVPDSDTRRRCVLPDRTRQGAYRGFSSLRAGQFSAASAWACAISASRCSGLVALSSGHGRAHHAESLPSCGTYQICQPGWRCLSSAAI